jgi:anti-sigma factor RsiW
MNEPPDIDDPRTLLERLASGTLEGHARRELFRWLESDPARWRQCALMLLESRELEQALGDWRALVPSPAAFPSCPEPAQSVPAPRPWTRRLTLVAGLLIAFGLGVLARGARPARDAVIGQAPHNLPSAGNTIVARPNERPGPNAAADSPAPVTDQAPSRDLARARPQRDAGESLPPYVRSQLEKHGYRVDSQHKLVAVALPDGRSVKLPLDQFQFRYVGHRSY